MEKYKPTWWHLLLNKVIVCLLSNGKKNQWYVNFFVPRQGGFLIYLCCRDNPWHIITANFWRASLNTFNHVETLAGVRSPAAWADVAVPRIFHAVWLTLLNILFSDWQCCIASLNIPISLPLLFLFNVTFIPTSNRVQIRLFAYFRI